MAKPLRYRPLYAEQTYSLPLALQTIESTFKEHTDALESYNEKDIQFIMTELEMTRDEAFICMKGHSSLQEAISTFIGHSIR